jgi:hypothetical protein
MAKRKRYEPMKSRSTAGPIDESTGQRSVFPQVVSLSGRDSEWRYDEDDMEGDNGGVSEMEDLVEETHSSDMLISFNEVDMDYGDDAVEDAEDKEEEVGEIEEDDWEVEPQTEAIAYLHSVRTEAGALPAMTYVPRQANGVNVQNQSPPKTTTLANSDNQWQTQFLQYYNNLRGTIINAPEPNLSQDELDTLLHIDPNNRPNTSNQEDRLWRLKTLDQPSVTLLSMLDHQRTIHLLTHLRKKMSTNVKEEQCMWLVFLLARLGDPGVLSGEEMDLLRRIGRKCLTVRTGLEDVKHKVILSTVDMVVCIIKHYYQQKDLEETIQVA